MIVNVHMNDGTIFQFASRRDLRRACVQEPGLDERMLPAFARWGPAYGPAWTKAHVAHIGRGSIAYVVDARDVAADDADLPAKAIADERAAQWQGRQPQPEPEEAAA